MTRALQAGPRFFPLNLFSCKGYLLQYAASHLYKAVAVSLNFQREILFSQFQVGREHILYIKKLSADIDARPRSQAARIQAERIRTGDRTHGVPCPVDLSRSMRGPTRAQKQTPAPSNRFATANMSDPAWDDRPTCWICHEPDEPTRPLVRPCKCMPVHQSCLARWQLQSAGKVDEKVRPESCLMWPAWRGRQGHDMYLPRYVYLYAPAGP